MQVFVFSKIREGVREFNARLSEFCSENAITGFDVQSFGASLVLFLTLADDLPEATGLPTLDVHIRTLDAKSADLEEQLTEILEQENAKDADDNPHLPIKAQIVAQANDDTKGWLVIASINGEVEDEPQEPEEIKEGVVEPPETPPSFGG